MAGIRQPLLTQDEKEYAQWCSDEGKSICDDTAEEFLALKSVEMEEAMEKGDL